MSQQSDIWTNILLCDGRTPREDLMYLLQSCGSSNVWQVLLTRIFLGSLYYFSTNLNREDIVMYICTDWECPLNMY